MLTIDKVSIYGFDEAIRSMRNPKNSWDRSDSYVAYDCKKCGLIEEKGTCEKADRVGRCEQFECYELGPNDLKLSTTLANAGTEHCKFLRMINVYVDITAPLYWYKEMDTYKVGTVCNSCSTMHKIHAKEFTLDDFSHEHIEELYVEIEELGDEMHEVVSNYYFDEVLRSTISALNEARYMYLKTNDKRYWWQMIQLLPSSYNQKRTYMLNYATLKAIYHQRKDHKLDEWDTFCDWIETLPYTKELITGEKEIRY